MQIFNILPSTFGHDGLTIRISAAGAVSTWWNAENGSEVSRGAHG